MNSPVSATVTLHQGPSSDERGTVPRRTSAFDLVAATPWAIQPDMLDTIRAIALREGEGVEAVEARLGRPLQNARKVTLRDSVAIVPITGPIMRYANLFSEISGATSLDVLARDFTTALDDPAVKAIVLDINSPGGQAAGISDFAQMVRGAGKPVVAFIGGMAASAAYWIAAAASEVVISKSGMAGNVGAVLGLDVRKDPNKAEIVSSQSPNKRPDATTDAGRAQLQALVDALAQVFIDDVAAYRGLSSDAVIKDFNGGDMFIGAKAVAARMADRIGTLESVIAGLAGKPSMPAPPTHLKGTAMTLDELRAAHPDLCAALVEEGRTAGLAAGAAAERQRILDVEAQTLPGHETLIAQLKADGKTSGAEAAVQVLTAERAVNAGRAKDLAADAVKPVAHAPAEGAPGAIAGDDKSRPAEERAKVKWDADEKLRAEFGTFETYLAYFKATESGQVKVLGSNK